MLIKAVLAFGLLLPVTAYSDEGGTVSGTAVQESVPDYSSWTIVNQTRVPVPVSGLKFPMQLPIASVVYVEDVNNRDSRYVEVFWVLGNQVVRRLPGAGNFQLLVNGAWQDAVAGAEPKLFLVTCPKQWYWPFSGTEVKGVRLEMPAADGKNVLKLEVVPVAGGSSSITETL